MALAVAAGSVILTLALLLGQRPEETEAAFAGTTKIELSARVLGRRKTVVLTRKDGIDVLLEAIQLEKKGPCDCLHVESAVFTTPKGRITVSLCDHCFDFGGKPYKMPAEFYEVFHSHFPLPKMSEAGTEHYRRLYAEYKKLVLKAVKANDKAQVLKLTEEFNRSLKGALLFARVENIPRPGRHFSMIDKSFAKHRHIPHVRYPASDKVHVVRLDGTVLVESNRNPDGKTYPDNVIIKLLFKLPAEGGAAWELIDRRMPCFMGKGANSQG